jgi:hypothetical protein
VVGSAPRPCAPRRARRRGGEIAGSRQPNQNIGMSATLIGAFALLVACAHAADFYSGTKVKVLTEASFNDLVRGGNNGGWLVEF